jgi:hypothetical protein
MTLKKHVSERTSCASGSPAAGAGLSSMRILLEPAREGRGKGQRMGGWERRREGREGRWCKIGRENMKYAPRLDST